MRPTTPAAAAALVRDVLEGANPASEPSLIRWVSASPRFAAFVAANRDKIRKKLRAAGDGAGRAGIEAELAVAVLLLGDRRVELAYEPAGGAGRGGPDFGATFRTRTRLNVEVTRLQDDAASLKLATTVCAKLRQLPPSAINVLALVTPDASHGAADVAGAVGLLKAQAARKEDDFFERRGLAGARDFHRLYPRLSGALVLGIGVPPLGPAAEGAPPPDAPSSDTPPVGTPGDPLWVNKEARHPLPADVCAALRAVAKAR